MAVAFEILVDASVWVKFFRFSTAAESIHLDALLQAKAVCTCAPIRVEILSGARSDRERLHLRELFSAIPMKELPPDLWEEIEEARFTLARKGHQASLVDLMIAATAAHHQIPLWTLDEDFTFIRRAVRLPRYLPAEP
jgi:predicted nucleic acid-binding protein